jgi:hypothetical protein
MNDRNVTRSLRYQLVLVSNAVWTIGSPNTLVEVVKVSTIASDS